MVSATILFQPGWTHKKHVPSAGENPLTGNPLPSTWQSHPGRGLLQEPLWTGFTETSAQGSRDERLVLFEPRAGMPHEVGQEDEFVDPQGRVWLAITEGMPRGIPGQRPEYVAARVRRAKEKVS